MSPALRQKFGRPLPSDLANQNEKGLLKAAIRDGILSRLTFASYPLDMEGVRLRLTRAIEDSLDVSIPTPLVVWRKTIP